MNRGEKPSYEELEERIRKLEAAQESNNINCLHLQRIINSIPDLFWVKDVNGRYISCNNRFEAYSGFSQQEITGKTDYDIIDKRSADAFFEHDQTVIHQKRAVINEEKVLFASDNKERYLETIKTPLLGSNNTVEGIVGIGRDITQRIQTLNELTAAKEKAEESDRLKSTFLSNLSHEIRTPMNGIIGFADLLNSDSLSQHQQKKYINIIRSSGNQLIRIIDDILEVSRLETRQIKPQFSEICLNHLLAELLSIFRLQSQQKNIELLLKAELSDKASYLKTDLTKLRKILSNLLENALRYTHEGFVEFGYYCENDALLMYVKDTGIGIEKDKQDIIFERFKQADIERSQEAGGLGLGLSIARENTELLGGTISVESSPGAGTTFRVQLPHLAVPCKKYSEEFATVQPPQNQR